MVGGTSLSPIVNEHTSIGGTFEFDAPDGLGDSNTTSMERSFMTWRRKGKKKSVLEETDDAVYFLTLSADSWTWTKPVVAGTGQSRPAARAEHSCCRTGTNEVTIFGGWTDRPVIIYIVCYTSNMYLYLIR